MRACSEIVVAALDICRADLGIELLRVVGEQLTAEVVHIIEITLCLGIGLAQQVDYLKHDAVVVVNLEAVAGTCSAQTQTRACAEHRSALDIIGAGNVYMVEQELPCCLCILCGITAHSVAALDICIYPLIRIDGIAACEHLETEIVECGVLTDTLHKETCSDRCGCGLLSHVKAVCGSTVHVSVNGAHARTEIMESADDIAIAPIALVANRELAVKIKYEQMLSRYGNNDIVTDGPRLHYPCVILVILGIQLGYYPAHVMQVLFALDGGLALMERVACIISVCAEYLLLILHEGLAYLFEERVERVDLGRSADIVPCLFDEEFALGELFLHQIRNKARVALLYRLHAESKLALEYLLTESLVLLYPAHRDRSAVTLKVGHELPRLERGTRNERSRLSVGKAEVEQSVIPYGLRTGNGKRHVYAVQCHHIYLIFPTIPVPPCGAVRVSAVVHINAELLLYNAAIRLGHRQRARLEYGNALAAPRDVRLHCVLDIPTERSGYRAGIVAAKNDLAVPRVKLIGIVSALGGNGLEHEIIGVTGEIALYQLAYYLHILTIASAMRKHPFVCDCSRLCRSAKPKQLTLL